MQHDRCDRAPVAANLHDVECGVERTERRADRIHEGIGINPGFPDPSEWAVVIEDDYRFAIPLRRPAVEEREGFRHVRGGIECSGRTIVQPLERLG